MILGGKALLNRLMNSVPTLIHPWCEREVAFGMTYGIGPAGYDIRVDQDLLIPPNGFILASSIEYFNVHEDLLGIVHDKSTWARQGLTVQNTVIEPGWRGYLTLELTNHSSQIVVLKQGMPIAQIIFHLVDQPNPVYIGKYQDQGKGPQAAKFDSF